MRRHPTANENFLKALEISRNAMALMKGLFYGNPRAEKSRLSGFVQSPQTSTDTDVENPRALKNPTMALQLQPFKGGAEGGAGAEGERGLFLSIFLGFFCEFSCFFLLFLWFSAHALLVLPVVLLWWEFFSVYFSGFFGEFCWFSASDGLSAAPRVRNRSKSQRATTTHYVQPFVLLQLALGASGRPSLAPTGLKS